MVERRSEKFFSCKLCSEEVKKNLCIANCIGCKEFFCFDHLIEHRRELSYELDQLIQRHQSIREKLPTESNVNQHLEYINRWEYETIERIHKHAKSVKEKIQTVFNSYQADLQHNHTILGQELDLKRNANKCVQDDLVDLTQRTEELDEKTRNMNKLLRQMSIQELNQIENKYNRLENDQKPSTPWKLLNEIKLNSTYGYMAANSQQIFLGWKNRIVVYNLDGTKHDETRLQSTNTYGELCDLVWSSTMERFFILCRKSLFVHYPARSEIEHISNISLINQDNQYLSLATEGESLFLLTEKSLDQYKLTNRLFLLDHSIQISFILRNPEQETICCIRSNEDKLGLLVQSRESSTWRLDLYHIFPFHRAQLGQSFDSFKQLNLGMMTSFENNTFLFMNWETKFMQVIDQNGTKKIIDYDAYNACFAGTERRLVVNYMTHLKIYEI